MAGRLRKSENKAKAQHGWGLGIAELGHIRINNKKINIEILFAAISSNLKVLFSVLIMSFKISDLFNRVG